MKPQWPSPSPLTAALCEPSRSCTPNCPPAPLAPAPSALLDPRTRSKNVRGRLAVTRFQRTSVELKITSLLNLAFEAQARQHVSFFFCMSVTKELKFLPGYFFVFSCAVINFPAQMMVSSRKKKQSHFRSVISDTFDGSILSLVQCLTCDRVRCTAHFIALEGAI